jgi:hypothetical protein
VTQASVWERSALDPCASAQELRADECCGRSGSRLQLALDRRQPGPGTLTLLPIPSPIRCLRMRSAHCLAEGVTTDKADSGNTPRKDQGRQRRIGRAPGASPLTHWTRGPPGEGSSAKKGWGGGKGPSKSTAAQISIYSGPGPDARFTVLAPSRCGLRVPAPDQSRDRLRRNATPGLVVRFRQWRHDQCAEHW